MRVAERIRGLTELARECESPLSFGWKARRLGLLDTELSTAPQSVIQSLMSRRVESRRRIFENERLIIEREKSDLGTLFWVAFKRPDGREESVGYWVK